VDNLPNRPEPANGRWQLAREVIVRRVALLADLAVALVELGWSSRLSLEGSGQAVLSVPVGRRFVSVAVVQDARGAWAYVWGASARFPAGVGGDVTRQAASALAEAVR
jgi:hypothetical protein